MIVMHIYLGLLLAWFGVGLVTALAMGRFVAAGAGKLSRGAESEIAETRITGQKSSGRNAEITMLQKRDAA
jgi:hypothetical protein